MSIYHLNMSNVSRAAGSSSCATLSYISGVAIHEERTNTTYSYGRAERVMCVGTLLPSSAPAAYQNPEKLFNAIEDFETAENARTAKKIEIALPREFDLATQRAVVEDYIKRNLNERGYAATYAIHHDKDGNNPHAHILVANRQINQKGEWGGKRKMIYETDADGNRVPLLDKKTGQQKVDSHGRKQWKRINAEVNPLDEKKTLKDLRKAWADICNERLEAADRIDHRSYADQGVDKIPTQHEGYAARAIAERGQVSEIIERNQQIREANRQLELIAAARQTCYANLVILEKEQAAEKKKEEEARRQQEGATALDPLEQIKRIFDPDYDKHEAERRQAEAAKAEKAAEEQRRQQEGADYLEQIARLFDPDYDKHQKEAEEHQRQEEAARAAARAAEDKRQQEQRRQDAAEAERKREDAVEEQYWIDYLGGMDAEQFDYFCNNNNNNEYRRRANDAEDKAACMWIKDHINEVNDHFAQYVAAEKRKIAPWLKENPKPYAPVPRQGNRLTRLFTDYWYKTSDYKEGDHIYHDKDYDAYRDHQQNLVDRWNCAYDKVREPLKRAQEEQQSIKRDIDNKDYKGIWLHVWGDSNSWPYKREHASLYHMIKEGARELIQTLREFAPVRAMLKVVNMLKDQRGEELQRMREQQREQQRQRSQSRGGYQR